MKRAENHEEDRGRHDESLPSFVVDEKNKCPPATLLVEPAAQLQPHGSERLGLTVAFAKPDAQLCLSWGRVWGERSL